MFEEIRDTGHVHPTANCLREVYLAIKLLSVICSPTFALICGSFVFKSVLLCSFLVSGTLYVVLRVVFWMLDVKGTQF